MLSNPHNSHYDQQQQQQQQPYMYFKTCAGVAAPLQPSSTTTTTKTVFEDKRLVPVVRIPSNHTAFRTVVHPPPVPPKSEAIRQRAQRIAAYQARDSLEASVEPPIPKPRTTSMMKPTTATTTLTDMEVPVPKPRRLTVDSESSPFCARKSSERSNTSRCSVASIKRRSGAHRPATPLSHTESIPIMDESEKDYLAAAVRQTYSADTSDSEDSDCSAPYGQLMRFPRKVPSLPSPTTDSGIPLSDFDEKRLPSSVKSVDDGFFDASGIRREEDSGSEILTSISNQRPVETEVDDEERRCGLSMLEKNARVVRWIHQIKS